MIDGLVVPLAAIGALLALTYAGVESTWVKVVCPLAVVFLLEPAAVSLTGGSIGHHLVGLRVRKDHVDERINIVAATVRFVTKFLFGIPAFLVVFVTRKRQGLHDLAARSLIVHKSATALPAYEMMRARTSEDEHATFVSVWRRILVILLYCVLLYSAASLILAVLLSGPCISANLCTQTQSIIAMTLLAALLCGFLVVVALGWRGHLYGCRKERTTA